MFTKIKELEDVKYSITKFFTIKVMEYKEELVRKRHDNYENAVKEEESRLESVSLTEERVKGLVSEQFIKIQEHNEVNLKEVKKIIEEMNEITKKKQPAKIDVKQLEDAVTQVKTSLSGALSQLSTCATQMNQLDLTKFEHPDGPIPKKTTIDNPKIIKFEDLIKSWEKTKTFIKTLNPQDENSQSLEKLTAFFEGLSEFAGGKKAELNLYMGKRTVIRVKNEDLSECKPIIDQFIKDSENTTNVTSDKQDIYFYLFIGSALLAGAGLFGVIFYYLKVYSKNK